MENSIENLKTKNTEHTMRVSQLRNKLKTSIAEDITDTKNYNRSKSKNRNKSKPFK